jgi:hypothetical protein
MASDLDGEFPEPEMTVGLERSHAQVLVQDKGLVVRCISVRRQVARHGEIAAEAEGIGLMAPFLMGTGEGEGTLAGLNRTVRLSQPAVILRQ